LFGALKELKLQKMSGAGFAGGGENSFAVVIQQPGHGDQG
jgi:hypothetical protein